MPEVLDREFARLATARALVSPRTGASRSLADDRRDAERWVARFGAGSDAQGDGHPAPERTCSGSLVVRPVHDEGDLWVLYVHGGGMVYYSTAVFAPFLRVLSDELAAPVEAFDYDKAPENPVLGSVADLARRVVARADAVDGRRLVLVGDSVGGLLALHLALRTLPGAFSQVVLLYPVLDLHTERPSYDEFGSGLFLDRDAMRQFTALLAPAFDALGFDPMDLPEADVARLPPTLVVTAGCDVLRDEAFAWVRQLGARGADVGHLVHGDLPHDFCLYAPSLRSARHGVEAFARSITGALRTPADASGTTYGRTT